MPKPYIDPSCWSKLYSDIMFQNCQVKFSSSQFMLRPFLYICAMSHLYALSTPSLVIFPSTCVLDTYDYEQPIAVVVSHSLHQGTQLLPYIIPLTYYHNLLGTSHTFTQPWQYHIIISDKFTLTLQMCPTQCMHDSRF